MTVNEASKSNNKWVWIGLGLSALFCLGACAIAVILLAHLGQRFEQGMKTDPEEAARAAHAIADYELPDGYQERVAMDFFVYSMVMIGPEFKFNLHQRTAHHADAISDLDKSPADGRANAPVL